MEIIAQKFVKYIVCMSGGLLLSFETALLFFVPCLLAIVLDIISAWLLGRRMHRRHPRRLHRPARPQGHRRDREVRRRRVPLLRGMVVPRELVVGERQAAGKGTPAHHGQQGREAPQRTAGGHLLRRIRGRKGRRKGKRKRFTNT